MAPPVMGPHALGKHGSCWAKRWTNLGTRLGPSVEGIGRLRTEHYEVIVLGECLRCNVECSKIEAPELDLRNLTPFHSKSKNLDLEDNLMRLPLLCSSCDEEGRRQRPRSVGVRAIIVLCHQPGAFEVKCLSQCFHCQKKSDIVPPPVSGLIGYYQSLLAMPCCANPRVKVTSLKMHFTPEPSHCLIAKPPTLQMITPKACGVCFGLVDDHELVQCQDCPTAYHAKCQKDWLSRRRKLMAPKCLYCFSPLSCMKLEAMVDVEDVYIHANSHDVTSLEWLVSFLPSAQDYLVRKPKHNVKAAMPSFDQSRPPLFLAWYRFSSEAARDAALRHAERTNLKSALNLRVLDRGDNKLRSHRKFAEVHDQ